MSLVIVPELFSYLIKKIVENAEYSWLIQLACSYTYMIFANMIMIDNGGGECQLNCGGKCWLKSEGTKPKVKARMDSKRSRVIERPMTSPQYISNNLPIVVDAANLKCKTNLSCLSIIFCQLQLLFPIFRIISCPCNRMVFLAKLWHPLCNHSFKSFRSQK